MIDFVLRNSGGDFRDKLRILFRSYFWRKQRERIPLELRAFSAFELCGIVIAIDVDLANFLATGLTDFGVAPVKVGPSAIRISHIHVSDVDVCHIDIRVADVRDVYGVLENVYIAPALELTAAAFVRIRTKMADVHKGITVRPDIAFSVHPGANPDTDTT